MDKLRIFDTHAHIYMKADDSQVVDIIRESRSAGIDKIMMPAVDLEQIDRIAKIAEDNDGLYYSVGVHPAFSQAVSTEQLISLSSNEKCKAIGECGYDFYWDKVSRADQGEKFQSHIDASIETRKPLIIHSRDADDECFSHLANSDLNTPFIMHCFSSDEDMVKRYLDLDCYLSFAGNITRASCDAIRRSVKHVPMDRILLETDSPYMHPKGVNRKVNNTPSNIYHTLDLISSLCGWDREELASISYSNAMSVFNVG